MSEPATPRVTRRPGLPLIWVVPLVALAVAGWMVARQFQNHGPEITIEFDNAAGLAAGKSVLEHKGVVVGHVREVSLQPDLATVHVRVRLTKNAGALAREGSQFWVVQPEVSFSGVRGLETLLTGVRLQVRPGTGASQRSFRGLPKPPILDEPGAGRAFVLRTEKLSGLTAGSPVLYRDVKVGMVESTRLAEDSTAAILRIRIYTPYVDLVRTTTRFWNISGLSVKFGLSGAEVRSPTLQSLVAGGISFATPDRTPVSPPALENTEFYLAADADKEWLQWVPRIPITPVETGPQEVKKEAEAVTDLVK